VALNNKTDKNHQGVELEQDSFWEWSEECNAITQNIDFNTWLQHNYEVWRHSVPTEKAAMKYLFSLAPRAGNMHTFMKNGSARAGFQLGYGYG